ncbi:DUF2306 domain-containing protein [Amycolatopsis cihanbeyliensis]|uniref:Putative membrane protein DUF2306 n=1 Tax=Amycolatopsis cihanbeyliensis TaxID=1128664 RepID=A0A542DQ70_AMYCI|nr:DUF2306 domain-containing protein [Amycolatopsis cihanbeyliensis]TQJ05248.1 putative membrane protein DUF2306 [Amycolatopsis cihanbeyliensis]
MTQNVDAVAATGGRATGPTNRPTRPVWWRRPWIIPLALVVLAFLVYQLSPFRELNEETAPLPPHDGFPLYFPLLLIHMFFGTVAMITVVLQLWPWLRANHPRVHRISGRFYVVSALIGGCTGLVIVPFAPVVGQVGVSMATITWMAVTTMAFIRARQRQFAKHRRLMLYSFAIVMNNVWGVILGRIGLSMTDVIDINYVQETVRWVGWVGNLMLVQWWIYRTEDRRKALRRRNSEAVS